CDVRLAAPDASFGAVFSRIGLHPGGGCTYFLTRLLGPQGALRLLLDGGSLDAQAAVRGGLVGEIVDDPETEASAMAARWAKLDPDLARPGAGDQAQRPAGRRGRLPGNRRARGLGP